MVDELVRDLSDGVILINLIQQLEANKLQHQQPSNNPASPTNAAAVLSPSSSSFSSALFRSYNRQPKNPFQRSENLEQVLTFLRSQGSPLVGITAATLADGATHRDGATLKAALGLVWQLILRYDINEGSAQGQQQRRAIAQRSINDEQGEALHVSVTPRASAGSAKEKLLRWVDDTVAAQTGPARGPQVASFSDLADGRVFGHLINALQPSTVDVSALSSSTSRSANLRFVFDRAEEVLGIPSVLSPEEFADSPDRVDSQSLMTYLSFFKAWRPQLLQRKSIKLTLSDVDATKAQLQAVADASSTPGSTRHTPSPSVSGKALDTATQLELNEARHTITALQTALTDMQRVVNSKAKEEEEKKQPTLPNATLTARTSTASSTDGGADVQSMREQVEALKQERDELRLELDARTSSSSSSAVSPSSSSPSTSSPPSPSSAVEAKKLSLLESALKKSLAMQKELAQRVTAGDAAMTELRRTAEASSQQAKSLAEEVHRLQEEKAATTAAAASATSIAAMKEGLEGVRAELNRAQAQAAANSGRQEELQQKAVQAQADTEQLRLNYEQKIDQLEREADSTRGQLQTLEKSMADQLSTAKQSLQQQSEQQRAFTELQRALEASKTRATTLAEQVTSLEATKAAGEADRAKLQAELKAELSAAQRQLQSNQQQTTATVAKVHSNNEEMAALQRRLAEMQQEKDQLRLQYEQRLTAAEAKEKARETERKDQEEQQRQTKELEQAMQQALTTAKQSSARQQEMEKALAELRASSTAATGKAKALEAEVQRLEAEKKAGAAQMQKLQAELSSTSAMVQEAQKRQTAQSTKIESATATVAATGTAAVGLAEVESLRKERDALKEQLKQLQTKAVRPSTPAVDGVASAQLQEQERQLVALQRELQEARQQAAAALAAAPSHPTSPLPSGDSVGATVLAQLQAKHAFDLRTLDKEKAARIAALNERIHSLEAAAKSVRASDREREEEREGWERRVREAEEETKRREEAVKKERARAELALQEKKAAEDGRKKVEDDLRQRLDEAKETISLQRKEAQEGQALKKERAEQERRLGEERRKNRELLQRVEQIKRNRGEDAAGREGAGRSVSQRGSRRTSRAVSPVPPSHARSFDSALEGEGGGAMGSSVEEEKLPVVATATTDEEEGAEGAGKVGKAGKGKRKRKGGKGESQGSLSTLSSSISHLITVPSSSPSSQSSSRSHSPRGQSTSATSSTAAPSLRSSAELKADHPHTANGQQSHAPRPTFTLPSLLGRRR